MFRRLILAVACVTGLASCTGGVSYDARFAAAASPLATQIVGEIHTYTAALPDTEADRRSAENLRADNFLNAINKGDRQAALPLWFAVPGVRDSYITFLSTDPALQSDDGHTVLDILTHNAQALDYILAVEPHGSTR